MRVATVIYTNGHTVQLEHRPSLKEAKKIVEGHPKLVQVEDEEGKLVTLVLDADGLLRLCYA